MVNQTDNSLIQIFLPIINAGLIADGFTDVIVKQANQPTHQGSPTAPTIYFYKVASKRYGFLGRSDTWNGITSKMDHIEAQYYESTWSLQSLVLQNPTTPNQYTTSDLADEAASIMQSDSTRDILNSNGIGILRISDIVNPYFADDRNNYEAVPSFDFVLLYENKRASINPVISQFTTGIYPI
jgi:hypothetical protein